MCGLVGVAGNLFNKDLEFFNNALWADAVRGMHSTGILVVRHDLKTAVIKSTGTPLHLEWAKGKEMASAINTGCRVLLGHNRHATIGAIDDENAHPFDFPMVVGAHNGTLRGRSDSNLEHRKSFGTDSEALYFNINNRGVEEVIPEMEGAWALVWYNKIENTINFLRNDERPLSYCFSENGQQLYWASESAMLRWLVGRHGVKLHSSGIMSLKPNQHVRWTIPKGYGAFGEPEVAELAGHSADFFQNQFRGTLSKWDPNKARVVPTTTRGVETAKDPFTGSSVPTTGSSRSQVKPNEADSSKKSSNVLRLSAPDVGSASKAKPVTVVPPGPKAQPFIDASFKRGRAAGMEGLSLSRNPHPSLSILGQAWEKGRLKGLEDATTSKNIAEGMYPTSQIKNNDDLMDAVQAGNLVRAHNSEFISEKTWMLRTKGCCSWCSNPTPWRDMVDAKWVDRNTYICEECISQDKTAREILVDFQKAG